MLQYPNYSLFDAARTTPAVLHEAASRNKSSDCLYRGRMRDKLAAVAPHIFAYSYGSPFGNWLLKTGWGHAWSVLLKSSWPLPELSKHFQKFITVKTETGQALYFRFYDPRVLRIFLPSCDAAQIREFFGNAIDYFIVEDEDPGFALRFSHQNGILQTERIPVEEQIARLPEPEPLPPGQEDSLPSASQATPVKIPAEQEETKVKKTAWEPVPVTAPEIAVPPPADTPPAPNKVKTKWNMFD